MGKQILFYMAKSDEDSFIDYARTTGDVAIVPQTSTEELQEEFRHLSDAEGRSLGENCHLWNRSISPRPVAKHYPQQGYYWLDFMQSEVVNVMRSKMIEHGLSMGRLHVEDMLRDAHGAMCPKNVEFDEWVSDLFRWVKQKSVRTIDGAYVLPGADALIQSGIDVTGHSL